MLERVLGGVWCSQGQSPCRVQPGKHKTTMHADLMRPILQRRRGVCCHHATVSCLRMLRLAHARSISATGTSMVRDNSKATAAMQVFQPHTCSLKPWDAAAFSQCIKGRRLIFIGDSTTRQQFQSLGCLLGTAVASEHAGPEWNASSFTGGPYALPCISSVAHTGHHWRHCLHSWRDMYLTAVS